MIDTTPSKVYQQLAQEEIDTAHGLYNSASKKKRLKANLHFYNALGCAQKALERMQLDEVADNTIRSNMEAIITISKNHLPHDIEGFIEKSWGNYLDRRTRIYRELFDEFDHKKDESFEEADRRYLESRKTVFEGYTFDYGFLIQDKFIHFFNDPLSIYDNGSLWNACYAGCVRYTNVVLEFVILFNEFLEYRFLKETLETKKAIGFGETWAAMRQKYMNGKQYVQIDEMIADGHLEQFTADEVIAALHFCLIYKERYCEGYFMDCCEEGIIGKLLLHLKHLEGEVS